MHSRKSTYLTAVTLFAALTISVQVVQAQGNKHQPKYYVFNLGTAPLGGVPESVGINNLGWISGGDNLASNTSVHAVLWVGVPMDLGSLRWTQQQPLLAKP